jgi:FKBP-type peptidyl-prolyl cis-trans isomerase
MIMKRAVKRNAWAGLLPFLAMATGCASYPDTNTDDTERRILEAHVAVHYPANQYPNLQQTASGLYFMLDGPATAGATPKDGEYAFVRYTAYDLSGNVVMASDSVANSNVDSIARRLGIFSYARYYGPKPWGIGHSSLYAGLEEALQKMNEGEKARVLMPSWLSTIGGGERQLTAPVVFDIELLRVVPDMTRFEVDTLSAYNAARRYQATPDEDRFYFVDSKPGTGELAAIGDTFHLRYIGSLLDGFVFDTNIADSARYYRIYNGSKTYETMSVVYAEEMSLVDGFKRALEKMTPGGEAITFFPSALGYKETGSGEIPPHAPLCFYIKMERIGYVSK